MGGNINMSSQIKEEWHQENEDGGENFLSNHQEIRIGDCKNTVDGH